jgi:hypothetical protein
MWPTNSFVMKVSQSPIVTELEYILPLNRVKAFGMTTIISRVFPSANALLITSGKLIQCFTIPNHLASSSVKPCSM